MNEINMERYSRQMIFPGVGPEGQKKLLESRAAVVGMGALGTVSSAQLVRAGIGFIRLIDRDHVELSNLQRQMLYTEKQAADEEPKAAAAQDVLKAANSEVVIEPVIADLNSGNADSLLSDVDIVIDGSDNFEVRFLINEACRHYHIPWIYGGALQSYGMTMNFLGGDDDPCFCCMFGNDSSEADPGETCSSAGVVSMITNVIASIQAAETVKILTGSEKVRKDLLSIDLWNNKVQRLAPSKWDDCPVCNGKYSYYGKAAGTSVTSLCGRDSVQIVPPKAVSIDFDEYEKRLSKTGKVTRRKFTLDFENGSAAFKLFSDGRAIIKNITDENKAKSVYSEYIGL